MTHIQNIRLALTQMLTSNDPVVMSLSGNWGTGKSYFWHEYIRDKKLHPSLRCQKYSYISLFGIDNLDQLKQAIFERTVPIDRAGEKIDFRSFLKNLKESMAGEIKAVWRKGNFLSGAVSSFLGIGYLMPLAYKALYLTISNTLICIDDLERKGANLRIQDVLGLVSELKEQRECQIILISNKDQLIDSEDYENFSEKVIDYEYHFERNTDDIFDIGFPSDRPLRELYREKANTLDIKNVRVISKMAHFDAELLKLFERFNQAVYEQAAASIPLLVAIHYSADQTNLPTLDYLKKRNSFAYLSGEESENEQEAAWNQLLQEYPWSDVDELDEALDEMIVRGYPDRDLITRILSEREEQFKQGIRKQALRDLWDRYRFSLVDDEEELIAEMLDTYNTHLEIAVPGDINALVTVLRALDRNEDADEIIDRYIDIRQESLKQSNIRDLRHTIRGLDDRLLGRIETLLESVKDERALGDVLEMLITSDGWGLKDEDYMANVTEDEFYDFFRTAKSRHVVACIRRLVEYARSYGEEHAMGIAGRRAISALERLSGRDRLTALKLSSWGIHPPTEPPEAIESDRNVLK